MMAASDDISIIQVWFLRHGKTPFNYKNSSYDDFIAMLCNGHGTRLADDPEIDFKKLPRQVDIVGHSPTTRAVETAVILGNELDVKQTKELDFLREVKFDPDIIGPKEYKTLARSRKYILTRWFEGSNQAETFDQSLRRVKEIETFLNEQQQAKTIILVTHGWFLRLLEVYFGQGKHTGITLEDILKVKPVALGHCIKATVAREGCPELRKEKVEDDAINSPMYAMTGS
jgi:broad specificity phosphatase PhoE